MVYRIGWISPFTPASGVGTFSLAISNSFPSTINGRPIDLTILYGPSAETYSSRHRLIRVDTGQIYQFLDLFDLVIYNAGNNREHHEIILELMKIRPGIVILHDYVYQHHLVARLIAHDGGFHTYAALLYKYGGSAAAKAVEQSRITTRSGRIRYGLWDTEYNVDHPLTEMIGSLGSAVVVHSEFALRRVRARCVGPILHLGMPFDQKLSEDFLGNSEIKLSLTGSKRLRLVSFGYIQNTKCVDLTVEAIGSSPILRERVHYTIAGYVGDPAYLARIQEMIISSSLSHVVEISANLSEMQLARVKQEADVFINLRRPNTEGSSASLIEQMICGRPVVVFDSGCYGEIPGDAAVKVDPHASVLELREALESLLAKPQGLHLIGEAGRRFAQSWTCQRYVDELLRFIWENLDLLQRRGRVIGHGFDLATAPALETDAEWVSQLATARKTLRLFDLNLLSLEPAAFCALPEEEAAIYAAQVILGVFDNSEVLDALMILFSLGGRRQAYFDCVKLSILADALYRTEEAAIERMVNVGPLYDLEFWAVIEFLPAPHYYRAAALLLTGTMVSEVECFAYERETRSLTNKRIVDLFDQQPNPNHEDRNRLKNWIGCDGPRKLPCLNDDLVLDVGGKGFRESVNLIGFYGVEADRVWVEGKSGLLGLLLGDQATYVEFFISQLHASPSKPSVAHVRHGGESAVLTVTDPAPHWFGVSSIKSEDKSLSPSWFELSISFAGPPLNTADSRQLGMCLLALRISTRHLQEPHVFPEDMTPPALPIEVEPMHGQTDSSA